MLARSTRGVPRDRISFQIIDFVGLGVCETEHRGKYLAPRGHGQLGSKPTNSRVPGKLTLTRLMPNKGRCPALEINLENLAGIGHARRAKSFFGRLKPNEILAELKKL
jgi:hypothetical protein